MAENTIRIESDVTSAEREAVGVAADAALGALEQVLEDRARTAVADAKSKAVEKLGDNGVAAVKAVAQPASSPENLAARVAAAIVVANNPELAPFGQALADAIEVTISTTARKVLLGWRRFLPWR
jgi:hypothetical protein